MSLRESTKNCSRTHTSGQPQWRAVFVEWTLAPGTLSMFVFHEKPEGREHEHKASRSLRSGLV